MVVQIAYIEKVGEAPGQSPLFLIIDLFCGAGGVTTGFAQAELKKDHFPDASRDLALKLLSGDYTGGRALKDDDFFRVSKVIACINHDHKAILSHWINHKDVKHFEEDIRNLDLTELVKLVARYRKRYPKAYVILWASLECTNYSKAKGGLARDEDSRTLAYTLYKKWNESLKEYEDGDSYIQLIDPDFIMIENVTEFKDWGPSRPKFKNGKPVMVKNKHGEKVQGYEPIPELKGTEFKQWSDGIVAMGYAQDWKNLNAADFGAFTSRDRLFGVFAKNPNHIIWPSPTHSKKPKPGDGLLKWNAVKEKLDFSDQGYSIFHRSQNMSIPKRQRKDLVDPTMERIYAGCIKHIAGGKDAFMTKYHGHAKEGQKGQAPRTHSLDDPLKAIDTQDRFSPVFITKYFSGKPDGKNIPLTGPAGTFTTKADQALIGAEFIDIPKVTFTVIPQQVQVNCDCGHKWITSEELYEHEPCKECGGFGGSVTYLYNNSFISVYHGNGDNTFSVHGPGPTIAAADVNAIIQANFLVKKYSSPGNHQSVEIPAGTLTKKDTLALTQASFIDRPFTDGGGKNSSIEEPVGSILNVPKLNLVQAEHMIDTTQYANVPSSIEEPAKVTTANRKYPYLLTFQYHQAQMQTVERPAPVILATSHKTPQYLLIAESGQSGIIVYETDSPIVVKLKEFMALYNISDIKMRMLRVDELLKIQGFPDDYGLTGSQEDQKKFIGNSVVPQVVKSWCEAMAVNIISPKRKTKTHKPLKRA